MSIASSFRGKTIKQESPSGSDTIIMETPRKRRKTIKFEEANNDLKPISEMPLYVLQQPVQVSNKDPYRAAYVRSLEIRNCFETRPEIKRQQREIPHDLRMSSQHPDTGTNIPRLASQEAFVRQLRHLSTRSAAKNATNTQFVHIEPNTYGNDEITTIEYGESTLTLKNHYQRYYLSKEARTLLTTFHPAGSEGRNRQLEYLLDPNRAAYGFQDCNGYEAPIAGVNLARELEYNIWYQATEEEALGRLKTSAAQVPAAQDKNNHMKSPGAVMYFDGNMRLFDDLRGVPRVWGEVGRARRIVSSMNHPNEGRFDAVGGLRIL